LSDERDRLDRVVVDTEAAADRLAAEEQAARAAMKDSEARLEAASARQRQADVEQHRWAAREEALTQALDQARARAGVERLADVAGVMGPLLELVEVEDGFQAAFEAAAGPVLAAVVVDGVDAARRGLHEFHRGSVPGGVITVPEPGAGARSLAAWPEEEAASS